jgi:hypothetical protein
MVFDEKNVMYLATVYSKKCYVHSQEPKPELMKTGAWGVIILFGLHNTVGSKQSCHVRNPGTRQK